MAATTASISGLRFICEFEGFPSGGRPYLDPVGIPTIGYGTTYIDGKPVTMSTPRITRSAALLLLRKQVNATYGAAVATAAKRYGLTLNQHQFDALTSCVYNLGPGILAEDRTLGGALAWKDKNGRPDHRRIARSLLVYDKAGNPPRALAGLTRRRRAEADLYLRPVNDARRRFLVASEELWKRRHAYRHDRLTAARTRRDRDAIAKWTRLRDEAKVQMFKRREQIMALDA